MTTELHSPVGVLLMAYGGPDSLDDLPGYLADIRGGRATPKALLDEITHHYALIGGRSPLLDITRRQANAIERLLNAGSTAYRVYLGMRHWAPWIEDTVAQMIDDGIRQAVAIALAPHYSSLSFARYRQKVELGLQLYGGSAASSGLEFAYVDSYHDAPKFIEALVNRVRDGLARWPDAERDTVHVILSAHSLPVTILKAGDPYQDQLFETARLVAAGAGLRDDQWSWSYQSAGRSPEPWLGPQIQDHIPTLAAKGIRNIVSVPIGFVADHVEILYDIDILAQSVAQQHGIRLERPPALNDDPLFVEAVAGVIRERAAQMALEQQTEQQ